VRLITALGDDTAGRFLREAMQAEGVELVALPAPASGSVVALLDADGERTMLSDRAALAVEDLAGALTDADWVHVSGYALRDAAGPTIAAALAARAPGVRVSIGGGSLPPGEEAAAFAELLDVARPELLVLSRDEADALPKRSPLFAVVTDGRHGSTATAPGMEPMHVAAATPDAAVIDATGAGDAYAAALIAQLSECGAWPPPAVELRRAMGVASRLGAGVATTEGAQGRVG
jgi:sugar/nucleoside kinase (ribokinase family)